jgi:hypothetical protein
VDTTANTKTPTAPALFGVFGLWPSLGVIQSLVTTVTEYGFHMLRDPPWPPRPGIDRTADDPAWLDVHLIIQFHPHAFVKTSTPGLWLRHNRRAWGDPPGGLGDFCTAYGLAGMWLAPSLGWNAKPEGNGGCVVWLPGSKVQSFPFHIEDPWPEPASRLLRTPCLAKPSSGHGRLAFQQRGQEEDWPEWMMDSIRT